MLEISSFARDAGGDKIFTDVAVYTIDSSVGGSEVGSVLGRHGVAGFTAKLRGCYYTGTLADYSGSVNALAIRTTTVTAPRKT